MSSFARTSSPTARHLAGGLCIAALLLGACGGDDDDAATTDTPSEQTTATSTEDDSPDSDAVVDDLTAQLLSDEDLAEVEFTQDEARCAAQTVVDELGPDQVEAAVLTAGDDVDVTDLADDEIAAIAGAMEACVEGIDTQLAAAVSAGILDSSDDSLPIDATQAECVATAVVDALGVERLLVVGAGAAGDDPFTAGAVTPAEGDAIADGFLGCVDIRQVFLDQFRAEGVPEETATCLVGAIEDASLRSLFAAEFTGQDVDPDTILGPALQSCGVG